MKQGAQGPEFTKDAVVGANGGGVSDKVPGSPSTSIAIDSASECAVGTFGYNSKDPAAIRSEHQRNQRYERGGF